jgi:hypothetical protein
MTVEDVKIGDSFTCGGNRWHVTDVGRRTVVAIAHKPGWMNGPPYALAEMVFDENDLPACEKDDDRDDHRQGVA